MLDSLKPLSLGEAARLIGVDPFEVVRMLVQRKDTETLRIPRSKIDELKAFAGVELWWTADALERTDEIRNRGRALTALTMLLDRGHVGPDATTRVDNLWRGLPLDAQGVLDLVVEGLAEEGLLLLIRTPRGLEVAAASEESANVLRAQIESGDFAAPVARAWGQG